MANKVRIKAIKQLKVKTNDKMVVKLRNKKCKLELQIYSEEDNREMARKIDGKKQDQVMKKKLLLKERRRLRNASILSKKSGWLNK